MCRQSATRGVPCLVLALVALLFAACQGSGRLRDSAEQGDPDGDRERTASPEDQDTLEDRRDDGEGDDSDRAAEGRADDRSENDRAENERDEDERDDRDGTDRGGTERGRKNADGKGRPKQPRGPAPVELATGLPASEPRAQVRADTEARGYGNDPRFATLASEWADRVRTAMYRLPVVTGLVFAAGPPPRVVLAPMGDERVPFEVRTEVLGGRRRASVIVNAERLLSGVADVDQTLLHALGAAVLEDSRSLRGDLPGWIFELAGLAASGDVEQRLTVRHRDWTLGARNALHVDASDDEVSEATALGALLLLAERAQPNDVRKLLRSVAGGDDPNAALGRLVGESAGGWQDSARLALAAHVRERDDASWLLLQRAEAALEEAGRAGLLAELPRTVPADISDEVRVLRARAALNEGDGTVARSELRALSGDAYRTLRDPAAAVVLRVEAEVAKGGDPSLARQWARRHELDFPKHPSGERLRALASERGMQEDPQAWMRAMRRRIVQAGSAGLDLSQISRFCRSLLLDHRAGAAEQFFLGLGARGTALELHLLAEAVSAAQEDPTIAARARASDRIGVWLKSATAIATSDVVDGGIASALVLTEMLISSPDAPASDRARLVDLLTRCAGGARVLRAMDGVWRQDNRALLRDLAVISRHVSLDVLEVAIFDSHLPDLAGRPPQDLWDAVAFGLPRAWLQRHPAFLERVQNTAFGVRRRAIEALARDSSVRVPPALIGHLLTDESPVLRRTAVVLAGRGGHRALAERGLEDSHASVRRVAATALARTAGTDAIGPLLRVLRQDPEVEVRAAAAFGLLAVAPDNTTVMQALVATQRSEDSRLRHPIELEISKAHPAALGPALVRAIRQELRRRPVSRAAIFRWMAIFQRASGIDHGYHPESTRPEIQAIVARIQAWSLQARAK